METEEIVLNLEEKDVRKGAIRAGDSLNLWHLSGLREVGLGKAFGRSLGRGARGVSF